MFHLIPFLAGAAAGAAVTYVVTDPQTRAKVKEGADLVAAGVKAGFGTAKNLLTRTETSEPREGPEEDPEGSTTPT